MQVTVPQPCHEDWGKMTPQDQGRFCDSCQKCVVDFSVMTDKQIVDYMGFHGASCGNFSSTQLNRDLAIEKPYTHSTRFYKWAAGFALLVGVSKPMQTFAEGKPLPMEWVNIDKEPQLNCSVVPADEPVGKEAQIKYLKFRITKQNGRPYKGPLTIDVKPGYYDKQTYEVMCDADGYTEFEIVKPFDNTMLSFTFSNDKNARGYFSFDLNKYQDRSGISLYIVDKDSNGLLLNAEIDTRYYQKMRNKRFWRKFKFWRRRRMSGYYAINPVTPQSVLPIT